MKVLECANLCLTVVKLISADCPPLSGMEHLNTPLKLGPSPDQSHRTIVWLNTVSGGYEQRDSRKLLQAMNRLFFNCCVFCFAT